MKTSDCENVNKNYLKQLASEALPGIPQTSKMECFVTTVN